MTRRVTWRTILVIPSDYESDTEGGVYYQRLHRTQREGGIRPWHGMAWQMLDVTLEISHVAALHLRPNFELDF
jgi:hypothetical protein